MSTTPGSPIDPIYALAQRFKYLRLSDVSDGLDSVGRPTVGLVDPAIRPLWLGMKVWGVAVTERMVPANRPMPPLNGRKSHAAWYREESLFGRSTVGEHIRTGSVLVTSTGESGECGRWGSSNALAMIERGAVGIVTSGYCRDTFEVALQKTPIACRARGRTIIPGRLECAGVQEPVDLGGALVRPGDIVGCDDDGVIVVPHEVAAEVLRFGAGILVGDVKARRGRYERLGIPLDDTVAVEVIEPFYADLL
ncbi:MAG TPA: RraA family protein [Chloroflexota bacterium]|nr:RraA family protein [Chloroflexota bacterium]